MVRHETVDPAAMGITGIGFYLLVVGSAFLIYNEVNADRFGAGALKNYLVEALLGNLTRSFRLLLDTLLDLAELEPLHSLVTRLQLD